MPETGPLTRSMDKQFEKLFAMMAEMKAGQEGLERKMEAGQEEMRVAQAGLEQKMEAGQAGLEQKMEAGQERLEQEMRSGQEEIKSQIQAHTESQVEEMKTHVDGCIGKIEEEVQCVKLKIENVESEVQRKIEESNCEVQEKIGNLERRISELEERPNYFPASQLVASLRGSAAEVLQGIPADKLTELTTVEKALESRFGDSHLTQFYRTELKTRRQKPGESLQELAADVERLMSLAYAEFPLDVRESLAAQYFVDAIRDEDTQHSTRLMDAKDLKSSLAYSMKYEAARTVSKTSRHVRSMGTDDHTSRERDDKFEFFNRLEKLLNSSVSGRKNTPRRNPNVTCWKCNKKGHVQRECQAITSNQEN
ncbi:hypothetical protein AVEN_46627-1 [Araneus ventricosus]|uniref:CCHC-type domain-containing protein n=1 Tax=Araneus ventricosus TaxID=182803 RepID=A0A4Y2TB79_ARAVE|nr:hypothetical protein AVEN_46627-1 [Araneus ventricosus]